MELHYVARAVRYVFLQMFPQNKRNLLKLGRPPWTHRAVLLAWVPLRVIHRIQTIFIFWKHQECLLSGFLVFQSPGVLAKIFMVVLAPHTLSLHEKKCNSKLNLYVRLLAWKASWSDHLLIPRCATKSFGIIFSLAEWSKGSVKCFSKRPLTLYHTYHPSIVPS